MKMLFKLAFRNVVRYKRRTIITIGKRVIKKELISYAEGIEKSFVEFSAKSGKLLKVMTVGDIQSFKNRYYPTRVTMEDKLRKNSKTEMLIKTIQFDAPIPPGTFTERNLMRK